VEKGIYFFRPETVVDFFKLVKLCKDFAVDP
jgi:hypothetical protein